MGKTETTKFSSEIQMMKKIFLERNKVKAPRKLSRKKYNAHLETRIIYIVTTVAHLCVVLYGT